MKVLLFVAVAIIAAYLASLIVIMIANNRIEQAFQTNPNGTKKVIIGIGTPYLLELDTISVQG